jgi:hypothetical protein
LWYCPAFCLQNTDILSNPFITISVYATPPV